MAQHLAGEPQLSGVLSLQSIESLDDRALDMIPLATLEHLLQSVEDVVECVPVQRGIFSATLKAQKKIARELKKAFKAAAHDGSNKAVAAQQLSEKEKDGVNLQVVKMAAQLTFAMGAAIKAALEEETKKTLSTIWSTSKEAASKEAGISFAFGVADERAIAILNQHQVFWVNNLYSDHLSARIQEVAREVIVKQGLSASERSALLDQALKRELGVVAGGRTDFAANIPSQYAGNPGRYIDGVVHTAAHQSRMFSSIQAFSEARSGGQRLGYTIDNPNDRRTGHICRQLSGQYFEVSDGVSQMNRVLNAGSPRDVKEIAPWFTGNQLAEVLGDAERGSEDARRRLIDAGAVLPPFHLGCRSTISIVQ